MDVFENRRLFLRTKMLQHEKNLENTFDSNACILEKVCTSTEIASSQEDFACLRGEFSKEERVKYWNETTSVRMDQYKERQTFSDDSAYWNMADHQFSTEFMKNHLRQKQTYIQHQLEKYNRNKELISHLQTIQQENLTALERGRQELAQIRRERECYKAKVRAVRAIHAKNMDNFEFLESLVIDLKHKKAILLSEKEHLRNKIIRNAVDQHLLEEFKATKRLLDLKREQNLLLEEEMKRLEAELKTHEQYCQTNANDKEICLLPFILQPEYSYTKIQNSIKPTNVVLPSIHIQNRSVLTNKNAPRPGASEKLNAVSHKRKQPFAFLPTIKEETSEVTPRPPAAKKDNTIRKFYRKLRGLIE